MIRKQPRDYLNEPFSRIITPNDDGTFAAEIMEFPGCYAEGETQAEAWQNLEQAAEQWIESSLRNDREMPEPFSVRGFSGAISLRLPRGLHRQAARFAEREGTSLNQYIATAIAARVGADDLLSRMAVAGRTSVILNLTNLTQIAVSLNANLSDLSGTNAEVFNPNTMPIIGLREPNTNLIAGTRNG